MYILEQVSITKMKIMHCGIAVRLFKVKRRGAVVTFQFPNPVYFQNRTDLSSFVRRCRPPRSLTTRVHVKAHTHTPHTVIDIAGTANKVDRVILRGASGRLSACPTPTLQLPRQVSARICQVRVHRSKCSTVQRLRYILGFRHFQLIYVVCRWLCQGTESVGGALYIVYTLIHGCFCLLEIRKK